MPNNPAEVYEQLLTELSSGEMTILQKQIYELLKEHPQGLTRQDLILSIFGYWPESIDGNKDDRKIRKAIERMRRRLFPIISTSGKPGYRLDVSRPAVEKMLAELISRKTHIEQQIEAASKFYQIPVEYRADPKDAKQLGLAL
jgi:hypothetical protein